jgi:hypothetical protein
MNHLTEIMPKYLLYKQIIQPSNIFNGTFEVEVQNHVEKIGELCVRGVKTTQVEF